MSGGRRGPSPSPRLAVLVAAGGARWERSALEALEAAAPHVALARRCLDLTELLATAGASGADVAVLSDQLPGLDADSVARLGRAGLRTIAVLGPDPSRRAADLPLERRARLLRLGVDLVVGEEAAGQLPRHVEDVAATGTPRGGGAPGAEAPAPAAETGRTASPDGPAEPAEPAPLVAVWGPHGSPGRTTVALALAAHAAASGQRVTLLDADPYGGAVATHLGLLDEVSGLLAAARAANAGELDVTGLARLAREAAPRLRVLTGLPRPDRWAEVRPQAFAELLDVARRLDGLVVVDAGPGVPEGAVDPFADGPSRDDMTATALGEADVVVAVGGADPVGLTRLARALPDLREAAPGAAVRVVVNRMRATLGWSPAEVEELVAAVAPRAAVSFLPDDRAAADRALVAGRTLAEGRDSALRRATGALAAEVLASCGSAAPAPAGRWWGLRRGGLRRGRVPALRPAGAS